VNYQEIVASILSKLTNNKEKNREYLKNQMELYKNHAYGSEIIKELSRAMYENLSEEDKISFNEALNEDIKSLNLKLDDARKLFYERKYVIANEILKEYVEAALLMSKENETQRFFSFRNASEFFYATKKIKIYKKIVCSPFEISSAFNMLSYIAIEENNFVDAKEYCDKAIYYNPVNPSLYFEKITLYKLKKDYANMLKLLKEAYEYIFNHVELAAYYRQLGFYYTEINKLDVAFALYLVSLHFDISQNAYHEINYIRMMLKNPNYALTTNEVLELLEKENILFGINEENKRIIIELINEKSIKVPTNEIELAKSELEILSREMTPTEKLIKTNLDEKVDNIKMDDFNEEETTINNEYDYSNIIVTEEFVNYLVQYCDQVYSHFISLIEEDNQRNKKLKYEFQNYNYKTKYSERFEVMIKNKSYNYITCKNYSSFLEHLNNGNLKNIDGLQIELYLDYKKGTNDKFKEHNNSFKISFKPYEIKFLRKSNYNDPDMNKIENDINAILKKAPAINTIFCFK